MMVCFNKRIVHFVETKCSCRAVLMSDIVSRTHSAEYFCLIWVHTSVDCLHTYGALVIGILIAAVARSLDISLLYRCCGFPYLPHETKLGKKYIFPDVTAIKSRLLQGSIHGTPALPTASLLLLTSFLMLLKLRPCHFSPRLAYLHVKCHVIMHGWKKKNKKYKIARNHWNHSGIKC